MERNSEDQGKLEVAQVSEGITPSMKLMGRVTTSAKPKPVKSDSTSNLPVKSASSKWDKSLSLTSNAAALALLALGGYIIYRMVKSDVGTSIVPEVIPPIDNIIEIVAG